MRRAALRLGVVVAAAAACVAAVVPTGASSPQTMQARVACGARAATLLFWPQGHGAIASVGFPAFATPHLEIYKPGGAYPNANYYGYIGADGSVDTRTSCKTVAAPTIRARITPARVARDTTAIVCRMGKLAHFDLLPLTAGARLLVIVPPKTVVAVATIKQSGSVVTYNGKLCRLAPAPA